MEFKDYYKILGVDTEADSKAIKAAYRKLARKYHPDMNPNDGAEARFKEVAEAYQVLKDKKLRDEFDQLRKYGEQSHNNFRPPPGWTSSQQNQQSSQFDGDFSDFFNSVFGGQRQSFNERGFEHSQRSTRGQDVEVELPIFLEETLKVSQKEVAFVIPADGFSQQSAEKKHLKVKVPQGVMDGERIRLKGQGRPGLQGGKAGDLYLHIRVVPHPLFDVQGHNITLTIPLAPWEAALGCKLSVPTLDGKINLTIPADSQSGDRLRVKGKGLKSKAIIGDMFAVIKIVMPKKTSEKDKAIWRQLAKSDLFNPRENWSGWS